MHVKASLNDISLSTRLESTLRTSKMTAIVECAVMCLAGQGAFVFIRRVGYIRREKSIRKYPRKLESLRRAESQ